MMTKKDYAIIAAALADIRVNFPLTVSAESMHLITVKLSQALKADNPRFNPATFEAAVYTPRDRNRRA